MILHGRLEHRFQPEEALVDSLRVVTVHGDHFGASLAASDHLEGPRLNALDYGLSHIRGRLARESKLRPGAVRSHHRGVGAARIGGHDMDAFALEFAP